MRFPNNLQLQVFQEDERDEFGSYYCRNKCGLVFSTKATRNRFASLKFFSILKEGTIPFLRYGGGAVGIRVLSEKWTTPLSINNIFTPQA